MFFMCFSIDEIIEYPSKPGRMILYAVRLTKTSIEYVNRRASSRHGDDAHTSGTKRPRSTASG